MANNLVYTVEHVQFKILISQYLVSELLEPARYFGSVLVESSCLCFPEFSFSKARAARYLYF